MLSTINSEQMARMIIRDVKEQGCCYNLDPTIYADSIRVRYVVDGDRIGWYRSSKDFACGLPLDFRKEVIGLMGAMLVGQEWIPEQNLE